MPDQMPPRVFDAALVSDLSSPDKKVRAAAYEFVALIGKTFAAPVVIAEPLAANFKNYFVALTAWKEAKNNKTKGLDKAQKLALLIDDRKAVKAIVETLIPVLDVASRCGIGTHTGKVPDADRTDASYNTNPEYAGSGAAYPFVSGTSLDTDHRLTGTGNAANMKGYRALTARIVIEGRLCSVVEAAIGHEWVRSALIDLGFTQADIARITESYLESQLAEPDIGAMKKIVFWPMGEKGEYFQLAPVSSYALSLRSKKALIEAGEDARYIRRSLKVGGAKPWNAGVLNTDLGGRPVYFVSMPPAILTGERLSRLDVVSRRGCLLPQSLPKRLVLVLEAGANPSRPSNIDSRNALIDGLEDAVAYILRDAVLVAEAHEVDKDSFDPQKIGDEVERALVINGLEGLSNEFTAKLATRIGILIAESGENLTYYNSVGMHPRIMDAIEAMSAPVETGDGETADDLDPAI